MLKIQASQYDRVVSKGADFLDRTVEFLDGIQRNKVARMGVYAATIAAGLFILGGVFRVLAWTMQGWNQFSTVLSRK